MAEQIGFARHQVDAAAQLRGIANTVGAKASAAAGANGNVESPGMISSNVNTER